jgi:hypothetical protein
MYAYSPTLEVAATTVFFVWLQAWVGVVVVMVVVAVIVVVAGVVVMFMMEFKSGM